MSQIEKVKEATRVCLQKFAEGVMLGYRNRIFEAIDGRVREIKTRTSATSAQTSYIIGLKEAKTIIENLK